MKMIKGKILSICFVLAWVSLTAQYRNQSILKLEDIMQGEKFTGFSPENIQWSADSKNVYFSWNPDAKDTLRNTFRTMVSDPTPVKLDDGDFNPIPASGQWNKDFTQMVFSREGDLFLYKYDTDTLIQLTSTLASESNPNFSTDGTKMYYRQDNNLFSWDLQAGVILQLTDFRSGREKQETKPSEAEKWLKEDQLSLFDVLQYRERVGELQKERRENQRQKRPKTIYLGDEQLTDLRISPDEQFIFYRTTRIQRGPNTGVPDYVTTSGYTTELRSREKVGSGSVQHQMHILHMGKDSIYQVATKELTGIKDKPEFLQLYHKDTSEYKNQYDKERPTIIHGPFFSDAGKAMVEIKSLDNKDRWLAILDPFTGKLMEIDRQRDEAWIGGPGIYSWNAAPGSSGWFPDQDIFWFQSEKSGFSHIYISDPEKKEVKALTSGNFEILSAALSRDGKTFFVTANREGPHEQHFYHVSAETGEWKKITSLKGGHQVSLSPDESYLAIRYSYSNIPWELYLMPNEAGASMTKITDSTLPAFKKYKWREPELVWFTASDGVQVPARLYKPAKPARNGPAVIFVHGAGYLQNVHQWWSSYYREYMFHNFLADNGYTVLDIDFRASSGYGRDWRTAIYRHMGGKDLSDQVDGARWLVENHRVGKNKIGIYGGSYGGFITLMALFKNPETFASGAALRSVADWAHYNHGYTANILNTPVEDPEAYYQSSPIYFADGLKGKLLMLHGMIDVNVHFQDVVRLSQKLIELGKDQWEMAIFPLEDHGFVEPSSWLDEYKRIYRLFEETLR